ncbi:unnamed protein product [Durusdinium trenchii]|uniref:Uncharacterized protein n=1 Tax=Durusdinium trenchii TaxID=1381693 RepID=A0ABP0P320_9DINO
MSTIEFCEKVMPKGEVNEIPENVYDLGLYGNISAVLGDKALLWLLPVNGPPGDGLTFLSATEKVAYDDLEATKTVLRKGNKGRCVLRDDSETTVDMREKEVDTDHATLISFPSRIKNPAEFLHSLAGGDVAMSRPVIFEYDPDLFPVSLADIAEDGPSGVIALEASAPLEPQLGGPCGILDPVPPPPPLPPLEPRAPKPPAQLNQVGKAKVRRAVKQAASLDDLAEIEQALDSGRISDALASRLKLGPEDFVARSEEPAELPLGAQVLTPGGLEKVRTFIQHATDMEKLAEVDKALQAGDVYRLQVMLNLQPQDIRRPGEEEKEKEDEDYDPFATAPAGVHTGVSYPVVQVSFERWMVDRNYEMPKLGVKVVLQALIITVGVIIVAYWSLLLTLLLSLQFIPDKISWVYFMSAFELCKMLCPSLLVFREASRSTAIQLINLRQWHSNSMPDGLCIRPMYRIMIIAVAIASTHLKTKSDVCAACDHPCLISSFLETNDVVSGRLELVAEQGNTSELRCLDHNLIFGR